MADPLRRLLRESGALWTAVAGPDGRLRELNAALAASVGDVAGEPAECLASPPQRPALARLIAEAGPEWTTAVLAIGRDTAVDRVVRFLRDGEDVVIVAEAAVDEGTRLVDQVLALNDDLISAQRSLGRRQRELEAAEASSRAASERGARLEAITLGAFTERGLEQALARALIIVIDALGADGGEIALRDEQRRRMAG